MSSTQDQAVADIRYTAKNLPAHLGENPSEEALKELFSNYGWVFLCQITNYSGNTVRFSNPYWNDSGEVAPGETKVSKVQGWIPYWSNSKVYEVTYYNEAFQRWKTINIKDLEGNWWISFDQGGVDEDIRALRPPFKYDMSEINLTIHESGYEIYSRGWEKSVGRISFQRE